jgi:hypothetical protein
VRQRERLHRDAADVVADVSEDAVKKALGKIATANPKGAPKKG